MNFNFNYTATLVSTVNCCTRILCCDEGHNIIYILFIRESAGCTAALSRDYTDVSRRLCGHSQLSVASPEYSLWLHLYSETNQQRKFNNELLTSLQWHHNEHDGVSNHQSHDCLLNRLFRRRSKKHQSSASVAFVRGIHRWPVNSLHKWPMTRKILPFHDVIM